MLKTYYTRVVHQMCPIVYVCVVRLDVAAVDVESIKTQHMLGKVVISMCVYDVCFCVCDTRWNVASLTHDRRSSHIAHSFSASGPHCYIMPFACAAAVFWVRDPSQGVAAIKPQVIAIDDSFIVFFMPTHHQRAYI